MNEMTTLLIRPNPQCKQCHGEGEVFDSVPYGSTIAYLPSFCHCVEEQIEEGQEDCEIELVFDGDWQKDSGLVAMVE